MTDKPELTIGRVNELREEQDATPVEYAALCDLALRALSGGVAPPLVKILRDQRDECADALRGLLPLAKSYEGQYPLGPNGAIEVAEWSD